MKNFIFISPNFPVSYWKFCAELKNNGLRVLGIGDYPYEQLTPQLRESLHEYYKVANLENYDEVFRAVAFFTYKYGKIDWLESNNEYWLERDASLRTAFHITTGFQEEDMERIKLKSAMKTYYAMAGIPVARFHIVDDYEATRTFANAVGYPVIVKPDNGVGANNTYRLRSDEELQYFFATRDKKVSYIMEEFVNGYVRTYDAIIDANGEPIFESGNITPQSLMDVVNSGDTSIYYIVKELPPEMLDIGRRTVKAFNVRSRFVHLEFFVLNEDQADLGKKGDIIGLEGNMRPAGGFTPDMYDFAYETDVYKIWADMVAFNRGTMPKDRPRHFCAFIGRRDGKNYVLDHNAVMAKYGSRMKLQGRVPDALSGCMGNQMYIVNFDEEADMQNFFRELAACK